VLCPAVQPFRNSKPFEQKVKDEYTTTWLIPKLVGEVKFTEWTSEGEMAIPAFLVCDSDKEGTRGNPRTTMIATLIGAPMDATATAVAQPYPLRPGEEAVFAGHCGL
jgi:hypothetical protein